LPSKDGEHKPRLVNAHHADI